MNFFSVQRRQLRVRLGQLVYRTGLFRLVLPGLHPGGGPLSRRLHAYLLHYLEEGGSLPATLHFGSEGLQLRCDLNDHMLKPYLLGQRGLYEEADINHCAGYLRPGDVLIDIGANHGFWGFMLAARQPGIARLVAVEANPVLASRLRFTQGLNPGIPATIVEQAITRPGVEEVTFYLPMPNPVGNLSGLGSIFLHDFASSNRYLSSENKITCKSTSLDALVEGLQLPRVDLIKIDVEHAEDMVVEGAQNVIRHYQPRLVMMESSLSSKACRDLQHAGYHAHLLDEFANPTCEIPADYWGNLFFTKATT